MKIYQFVGATIRRPWAANGRPYIELRGRCKYFAAALLC